MNGVIGGEFATDGDLLVLGGVYNGKPCRSMLGDKRYGALLLSSASPEDWTKVARAAQLGGL